MTTRVGAWVCLKIGAVFAVVVGIAAAIAPPARAAPAVAALDQPAFTAAPAELLAAARSVVLPGAWNRVILRDDRELTLDDQGRFSSRHRVVSAIQTPEGIAELADLTWMYRPDYQDRPRIRARAIDPSGRVTELDPALMSETPVASGAPGEVGALRQVHVVLPPAQVGGVVELEIALSDRTPLLGLDGTESIQLMSAGLADVRLRLSAPAARRARIVAHNLPSGVRPTRQVANGRETWTFQYSQPREVPASEPWTGPDGIVDPYVALGAGTWSGVARSYGALIDRQIAAAPPAWPAGVPRAATFETVRAVVRWVHAQVRTLPLTLGYGPALPVAPADTITRRAGDTAAKAALIVALLRQAGLRADVALVRAAANRDVDVDLPGLQPFDRALVRAEVAGRAVWIDPYDPLYRPDTLSPWLRGRRALIINAATTGLTATPPLASSDNVVRQVRTWELAEEGYATRVTEVSREGGAYEALQREWIRDSAAARVRDDLTTYVRSEYRGALEAWRSTPPADLDTPFELTASATQCERATTFRDNIDVYLFPVDALEKVPVELMKAPAAGEAQRRGDYYWPTPHVMEIENRLIVPEGYTLPALEPSSVLAIGPSRLVTERRIEGRTVVITYRFDSGKVRLTPSELATVREEASSLTAAEKIALPLTGLAHAYAGRPAEAIAEAQRLIKLHPKHALHHSQLALIYLEIGMGAAARRAARQATVVEPRSGDAYAVLAHVLRRDSLGRDRGFDHDRAGALAALERALALDPTHYGALAGLVETLEHDPSGFEAGDADRPRLVQALRALYARDPTAETGRKLVQQLLHFDAQEAERAARELPEGEERDAMIVAAVAAGARGPAEAIVVAGTLRPGAGRGPLLETAADALALARQYEPMRQLYAAPGVDSMYSADVRAKVKREAPRPAGRDPAELWFALRRWMMDRTGAPFWDAETTAEAAQKGGPSAMYTSSRATWEDFMRAASVVQVTGTEAAWRIDAEAWGSRTVLFAASDRGVPKLIGSPDHTGGIARHVLRLVARGDLAAAAQLLDWVVPMSRQLALSKVWGTGLARDRGAIVLAAQLLSIASRAPVRDLSAVAQCTGAPASARATCDAELADGLAQARRWPELLAHGAAWAARGGGIEAELTRAIALRGLRRFDEAERALAALVAREPAHAGVARERIFLSADRHDYGEASRRADELAARSGGNSERINTAAWLRLFTGTGLATARGEVAGVVGPDPADAPSHIVNTLAALDAELGNLADARRLGWLAAVATTRRAPDPALWYVAGRIAEQLGLRDDASAMYRQVARDNDVAFDAYDLAQRGLARLARKAP